MTTSSYTLFVGVDIAAASASVSWQTLDSAPCPPLEIAQTKSGWRELQKRLSATCAGYLAHPPSHLSHSAVIVMQTAQYRTGYNLARQLHSN